MIYLFKGDIFQSPSGGANVIFTDVETLQVRAQDAPKVARKRASDDYRDCVDDRLLEERVII